MTKTSAPEAKLGALHAKVADTLVNALDAHDKHLELVMSANEKAQAEGNEDAIRDLPELDTAVLSAAITFLKNNSITCNTEDSQSLSGLAARLAEKPKLAPKAPAKVVPLRDLPVTEADADALQKLGLA